MLLIQSQLINSICLNVFKFDEFFFATISAFFEISVATILELQNSLAKQYTLDSIIAKIVFLEIRHSAFFQFYNSCEIFICYNIIPL